MSRRHHKRRTMAEMNVVPYIDVMLVLLVIFMVTAPMLQTGVKINLPDANANPLDSAKNSKGPLFISLDEDSVITLEDGTQKFSALTTGELITQLSRQLDNEKNRPVYIRADSNIAYKNVMTVMVAAQKAGAKKIGLMAEAQAIEKN